MDVPRPYNYPQLESYGPYLVVRGRSCQEARWFEFPAGILASCCPFGRVRDSGDNKL